MSDWPEVGSPAPEFTLPSDRGEEVSLSQLKGRPVVLYFYPKDDTPGCTKEACNFRDASDQWTKRGATLLGVSPDTLQRHAQFRDKYDLNFTLLADPEHRVAELYGAWREKNLYGKKSMGIQRSTFLIDSQGRIVRSWKRVRVEGHVSQVLEALDSLDAP